MSSWKHIEITTDNGNTVDAVSPYILSVSRSTDIPTSYMEWFIARLKAGYCSWRNPFNNQVSYVSFNDCRFVVFWSKNPATLLTTNVIDLLKERGIDFYLQYTLNDYFDEGLEPKLQLPDDRMDLFCSLSEKYGKSGSYEIPSKSEPLQVFRTAGSSPNTLGKPPIVAEHAT